MVITFVSSLLISFKYSNMSFKEDLHLEIFRGFKYFQNCFGLDLHIFSTEAFWFWKDLKEFDNVCLYILLFIFKLCLCYSVRWSLYKNLTLWNFLRAFLQSLLNHRLLCSPKNFGGTYSRRLVCPSVRPCVRTSHSCPAHNFVIWSGNWKLFYRNDHHVETTCRAQIWVPTLKVKVTVRPCSKIVSGP